MSLLNLPSWLKNLSLINNANKAWTFLSMQFPAVNLAFIATWLAIPEKLQDAVPVPVLLAAVSAMLVFGMAGRLVKQTPTPPPNPDDGIYVKQ